MRRDEPLGSEPVDFTVTRKVYGARLNAGVEQRELLATTASTWVHSIRRPTACCGSSSCWTAKSSSTVRPVIGYLHTGIEKTFEAKTYVQGVVLTDRMDYLNPLGNNLAYALSIEKLMGCEIPERATVLRVLLAELTRIASHLMFVGSMALDLGASSPFLYCLREREKASRFLRALQRRADDDVLHSAGWAGARHRVGRPRRTCRRFVDSMPALRRVRGAADRNPIFRERTDGVGVLPGELALELGVSGADSARVRDHA